MSLPQTGFSGLTSLASNVDLELRRLSGAVTPSEHSAQFAASPKVAADDGSWKRAGIIIAIIAGIGLLCFIFRNGTAPSTASYTTTVAAGDGATSAPAIDASAPTPDQEPSPEVPPIGKDEVLNVNQLSYCLSEAMRVGASRATAETDNQIDLTKFNLAVDDFNSRCSSYRYRSIDLTRAQAYVAAHSEGLKSEGMARMTHAESLANPIAPDSNPDALTPTNPQPPMQQGNGNTSQ